MCFRDNSKDERGAHAHQRPTLSLPRAQACCLHRLHRFFIVPLLQKTFPTSVWSWRKSRLGSPFRPSLPRSAPPRSFPRSRRSKVRVQTLPVQCHHGSRKHAHVRVLIGGVWYAIARVVNGVVIIVFGVHCFCMPWMMSCHNLLSITGCTDRVGLLRKCFYAPIALSGKVGTMLPVELL